MKKITTISLLTVLGAFGLACNGTSTTNTNANTPSRNAVSPNLPLSNGTPWVDKATPTPQRDVNSADPLTTNSNTNSAAANKGANSTSTTNKANSNN